MKIPKALSLLVISLPACYGWEMMKLSSTAVSGFDSIGSDLEGACITNYTIPQGTRFRLDGIAGGFTVELFADFICRTHPTGNYSTDGEIVAVETWNSFWVRRQL
ncbi:hypothetical protein HFD88_003566 [Aspergillus terreus]|nr:hypothetical protein HFD88_003566 [Aspergillus terreus]